MIVRKITQADWAEDTFVSSVAFEGGFDPTEPVDYAERTLRYEQDPQSRFDRYWAERWAAFTDAGEMMGSIGCYPYTVRYNGHSVGMSGIGGVATLPPYRRQGVIRACFREAFAEMRAKGQLVTMLYPFNDAFYRKFGYENAIRIKSWEIPMTALQRSGVEGTVEMFRVGGDTRAYAKVFEAFNARYELSSVREALDWKPMERLNPSQQRTYAYLWRDRSGAPKGYMVFRKEYTDGRRIMNCVPGFGSVCDFVFTDADGLRGLLDFAATFASDYDTLRVVLPYDLDIEPVLQTHNPLLIKQGFRGMLRVLDVERALALSAYRGSGRLRVGVDDAMCPWNEGVWQVDFQDGKACRVGLTDEAADVDMPVSDFSRLIFGSHDADELWLLPNLRLHADPAALAPVFYRKRTWIGEQF